MKQQQPGRLWVAVGGGQLHAAHGIRVGVQPDGMVRLRFGAAGTPPDPQVDVVLPADAVAALQAGLASASRAAEVRDITRVGGAG